MFPRFKILALLTSALTASAFTPSAFAATTSVRDSAGLQQAINSAREGDIVELAAGTYAAPAGGFTLFNPTAGFTVRAAAGAAVTLTGNNSTDILRFTNSNKPVIFQGLLLSNGVSTQNFIGGAMTMDHVQASFISCTFQSNQTNGSVTGGALWINECSVSFQGCNWNGNSSPNYGAAAAVVDSRVFIIGSRFIGNRCDLPSHKQNAAGGALFIVGTPAGGATPYTRSSVRISTSTFDGNRAGYVGGAIYTLGEWQAPESTPVVDLAVSNCLFSNNAAVKDPSVTFPNPTAGGAVHLEDQTTSSFQNCRFVNNTAKQGGAVSGYRTITDFQATTFTNNVATGNAPGESIGGAIISLSTDNSDSSTASGTINRRSSTLTMSDCLVRGAGSGATNAREGGGVFVAGDINAQYGIGGIRQDRSINNRGSAIFTRVVFDGLTAFQGAAATPGTGGAIKTDFAEIMITDSLFTNCSASQYGGAVELVRDGLVNISKSTFAKNAAGDLGAGITMFGGSLNLTNDVFVDNVVTKGNGSALTTSPITATADYPQDAPAAGLVSGCTFSGNSGASVIYDGDRSAAPFNMMQYSGNSFFTASVTPVLSDNAGALTVAQLNSIIVPNSGVRKTVGTANTALGSAAVTGAILLVPPLPQVTVAPGETSPIQPFVAFAGSGGTVLLDGGAQGTNAGVAGPTTDVIHTLSVGGQTFRSTQVKTAALNISTRLPVGTGDNALIGGFIIQGPVAKRIAIRAVGPSLNGILPGALQDPTLELHDSAGGLLAKNDNWRSTQVGGIIAADQAIEIQGSGVPPNNDAESTIIATLNPGPYTAIVRGANNSTGIAVVEAYDLDAIQTSSFGNLATRGFIQGGDNVMIGGFIVQGGSGPTQVVVRGIGPVLADFGITNAISDPLLEVRDANGGLISANDDWQSSPDAAAITAAKLQPTKSAESALLLRSLPGGAYTAILRAKTGSGTGLVEVYVF